jgi:hypothetical protein
MMLDEQATGEIGDPDCDRGPVYGTHQQGPFARAKLYLSRRPPAARRAKVAFANKTKGLKRLKPIRHNGAGEVGLAFEIKTGGRPTAPDEHQELRKAHLGDIDRFGSTNWTARPRLFAVDRVFGLAPFHHL